MYRRMSARRRGSTGGTVTRPRARRNGMANVLVGLTRDELQMLRRHMPAEGTVTSGILANIDHLNGSIGQDEEDSIRANARFRQRRNAVSHPDSTQAFLSVIVHNVESARSARCNGNRESECSD